jgi:AcrR family transcriptional regulator
MSPQADGAAPGRRVSRQREAGEATRLETRRRLLAAAAEEFSVRGYKAATVARIANRADVAVQTLYYSWGSKRDLLRGVLEQAVTGSDDVTLRPGGDLPRVMLAAVDPADAAAHPQVLLRHLVHEFRLLAERAASVWRTYRDAAAVDPDLAADWSALMEIRRANFRELFAVIPADRLREGVTTDAAVDTAWTIASPHTHDLLVTVAGYDYDAYERWVYDTVAVAVLRSE